MCTQLQCSLQRQVRLRAQSLLLMRRRCNISAPANMLMSYAAHEFQLVILNGMLYFLEYRGVRCVSLTCARRQ